MKADELHLKFAEKVRGDSKYLADLTSATSLSSVQNQNGNETIEASLVDLANDQTTFADIRSITGPTGQMYFYSQKYMTQGYARILARVKAGDPCLTIAETVREESKIYPRPTNVELFKYGLFKIDRGELDTLVARTLELNADIQAFRTGMGSLYLYCNLYLTPERATLLAKHQEHPDS